MKISTLLTFACILFSSHSVLAQNDSTRLDAGSLVLKKEFTQHISIKGEDLEKMPFANLTEAISVWLNGAYTVAGNLIYVVDGNIVSDVNAYSVHDIEEVVLLQNAGALTGTAASQQQMILITTRKGKGKYGIQGAAQTFLVHSPGATTNLYHQYYIGAYENLDKLSVGLSANYLRDVLPSQKMAGQDITTPDNMNRWRFNGDLGWKPNPKNTIDLHVGFVPQAINSAQNYTSSNPNFPGAYTANLHEHVNQISTWARWSGQWWKGWRNDFQVGYLSELQKGGEIQTDALKNTDSTISTTSYTDNGHFHTDHLYIRDRLSYMFQARGWTFEPSVNASYEYFRDTYVDSYYQETTTPGQGGIGGGFPTNISEGSSTTAFNGKIYVLTPTLDITYGHTLNITGGIVANVSHSTATGVKRIFPFASMALDLLRLGKTESRQSLKVFGSYARSSAFNINDWALNDLGGANTLFLNTNTPFLQTSTYMGGVILPAGNISDVNFWVWQAGARFASFKDRVQISYNFERRNFPTLGTNDIGGNTEYIYSMWTSSQHHADVTVKIIEGALFNWRSGLNTTVLRSKANVYPQSMETEPIGDYYQGNKKPSWTGGWTNRLRYKDLSMGLDLFYHFSGEVLLTPQSPTSFSRENTWLAQNIYVGYRLHLPKKMGLEVYVDSRGPLRGGYTQYVLDTRRYYGVGGKIGI